MYRNIHPVFQIMVFYPKQNLTKTPTELQYAERSVFMKEGNTQNFWTFRLGTQEGNNFPIWIFLVSNKGTDKILTI